MKSSKSSSAADDAGITGNGGQRGALRRGLQVLRELTAGQSSSNSRQYHDPITTQPQLGRGHALRDAHRTLRDHLSRHAALRKITPHLAVIERALAKDGSWALMTLPVAVLRLGLEQLALLQSGEDSAADKASLRVLQLRLREAIARRDKSHSNRSDDDSSHIAEAMSVFTGSGVESDSSGFGGPSSLTGHASSHAHDVSELTPSAFNRALRQSGRR